MTLLNGGFMMIDSKMLVNEEEGEEEGRIRAGCRSLPHLLRTFY